MYHNTKYINWHHLLSRQWRKKQTLFYSCQCMLKAEYHLSHNQLNATYRKWCNSVFCVLLVEILVSDVTSLYDTSCLYCSLYCILSWCMTYTKLENDVTAGAAAPVIESLECSLALSCTKWHPLSTRRDVSGALVVDAWRHDVDTQKRKPWLVILQHSTNSSLKRYAYSKISEN